MNKTPKLRFKEFSGEWQSEKLQNVSDVRDGTHDSPKYVDNGFPFITSKNLMKNGKIDFSDISYIKEEDYIAINKRSKVDVGDILFGMIGTIGNPVIVESDGFAIKNVALIKEQEILLNRYLIQVLKSPVIDKQFYKLNTGGTQKFIGLGLIRDLNIFIPSIKEQEKIASFFSLIDKKISLQSEKVEMLKQYKKGMMQKIFSRELRFKDDSGRDYPEWEHKKLNKIVERVTRKNKGIQSTLPLTISAQYGLVDQVTFFNKTVASSNLEGYYLLENGEFAYNKSYSTGYPFGAIKRLDKYDKGVLSSLYICFRALDNIDSDFLVQYFETSCWHKEISMIAVEGARNHGLLNISVADFFETYHWIPCYDEQVKIGKFLMKLDNKIDKEQEKLDSLNEYKKGLLQQMFV